MNLLEIAKSYVRGEEIIRDWLGSGGNTVSQEIADARALTCLACDKNTFGFQPALVVGEAVKKVLEIKNGAKLRTDGERRLGVCSVCHCYLRTKIWVDLSLVRKHWMEGEAEKLPSHCWQLTEQP